MCDAISAMQLHGSMVVAHNTQQTTHKSQWLLWFVVSSTRLHSPHRRCGGQCDVYCTVQLPMLSAHGRVGWLKLSQLFLMLPSCSGDGGYKGHNREISRSRTQKCAKLDPGASLFMCGCAEEHGAECTSGAGFRGFGHTKREKRRAILGAEMHTADERIVR